MLTLKDLLQKEKSITRLASFNYEERVRAGSLPVDENGEILTKDQCIKKTVQRMTSQTFLDFMNKKN